MYIKILKKDFTRNKVITIALMLIISLAALLISSGMSILFELGNSLDYLFKKADPPHFSQYHAGKIDKNKIEQWAENNRYRPDLQINEIVTVPGTDLFIGNSDESERGTVMENTFIVQNHKFDFLLNLNNEIIEVAKGEIAVPVYYLQRRKLKTGDSILIQNKNKNLKFTISGFVRDAQMNPSIVSSKRFLVNEIDFLNLRELYGISEYSIAFKLEDTDSIGLFADEYKKHPDLPKNGPAIDISILKLLNAMTDGLIIGLVIFVSILLTAIALLCLRYTLLATIEEDYREIGVMKAIGFLPNDIKKIYISKYLILGSISCILGGLVSQFLTKILSANILLYIGKAPISPLMKIIPLVSVVFILFTVLAFSWIILRRFNRISAVEAMRMDQSQMGVRKGGFLSLYKSRLWNANIFLGLRDTILRFKNYLLLFLVFIICSFIMIVPVNLLSTIKSPDFTSYMGIGKCDLLIDLRRSENIEEEFTSLLTSVSRDPDITRFTPLITGRFNIINNEGREESVLVETGDFSIFPLEYFEGNAPKHEKDIALSYLLARDLEKGVSDTLIMIKNDRKTVMTICGIYQDITNGGKTAKSIVSPKYRTALWLIIYADVNTDIRNKILDYSSRFPNARVIGTEEYLTQTYGNTINQLNLLTLTSIIISALLALLITSLFIKMLLARDSSQLAIMKSIGISSKDISVQYISRALAVLITGILFGTVLSNTLGQSLVSIVMSAFGAARITFIINPLIAYLFCPFVLLVIVIFVTLLSVSSVKKINFTRINAE